MHFENKLKIGHGIYTPNDISKILKMSLLKVHYWIDKYWDGRLGKEFSSQYSWRVGKSKAVSFHTMVEFYVMMQLGELGLKPRQVLTAHTVLSKKFNTPFPFANKVVLKNIKTDGISIYLNEQESLVTLDGSNQFNLDFIQAFFKNLDFDNDQLASRFWPLGKQKKILIDPKRKFGHPITADSNIYPETLYNMFKGGDSIEMIAFTYEITQQEVTDSITYCEAA